MRKPPQQARSRRMVERLIDATARTIAEEGLAAATTARIAEVAGVSIGSLYQYFGDKEQLYAALLERMTAELVMLVDQHSRQLDSQPLRDWVAGLLNAVWRRIRGCTCACSGTGHSWMCCLAWTSWNKNCSVY